MVDRSLAKLTIFKTCSRYSAIMYRKTCNAVSVIFVLPCLQMFNRIHRNLLAVLKVGAWNCDFVDLPSRLGYFIYKAKKHHKNKYIKITLIQKIITRQCEHTYLQKTTFIFCPVLLKKYFWKSPDEDTPAAYKLITEDWGRYEGSSTNNSHS